MPLLKLLSGNRAKRVLIRAEIVDEIISEANIKFNLAENGNYKVTISKYVIKNSFNNFRKKFLNFAIFYFKYLGYRRGRWDED